METTHRPGSDVERAPTLLDRIRRALHDKDFDALAALYAEDATLEEVSNLSPPAHPTITRGREGIRDRLRDEIMRDPVSGWARNLESATVIEGVETDDGLAFTEERTYAAGDRAIAQHIAHKSAGRIDHDRIVIAWDAD
jgi:hypothetical protein